MTTYIRRYDSNPVNHSKPCSGKLTGLTFSVKDIYMVAKAPCSFGVIPEFITNASSTSPLITTLCNEGAFLKGAVNLSPLCLDITPVNQFFGDGTLTSPQQTLLGSSFGSVLSLIGDNQDELVDFSIGSDSGGSIRAPAAGAGLYGLRLKSSDVTKEGSLLLPSHLDSVGILAKDLSTIEKVALTFVKKEEDIIAGKITIPDEKALARFGKTSQKNFKTITSFLSPNFFFKTTSSSIFENAFQIRKKQIIHSLKNILMNEKITPLLPQIPQGNALLKLAQAEAHYELGEDFTSLILEDEIIIHPTLIEKDPINFFLPIANVSDLYSLTMPLFEATPGERIDSITINGRNILAVFSLAKIINTNRVLASTKFS